ncbi:MAG: flagellar hook-length control protein FliK [Acidobacteriota bacterium]
MSAPRISAVQALLPAPSTTQRPASSPLPRAASPTRWPGASHEPALAAESGSVFAIEPEDLIVTTASGAVEGSIDPDGLSPGDVLLVKVLATSPRLALEKLGQAAQAGAAQAFGRPLPPPASSAAMAPDQTAMLRMAWAPPDAATLSTSWRVLVLEHLKLIAAGRLPDPIHHERFTPGLWHGQAEPPSSWSPGPLERWPFPVQAWAGMHMALHLLPPRQNARSGKGRKRQQTWGLRVNGHLPGLGRIELQTQLSSEGASLLIVAEHEQTQRKLREGLGALSRAVTRAGWRLRDCQILLDLPIEEAAPEPRDELLPGLLVQPLSGAATTLPQALFRVTAEVLISLGSFGSALTPGCR